MARFKRSLLLILYFLSLGVFLSDIKAVSKAPDLAITNIDLSPDGKLIVEIVNLGPGSLLSQYTAKAPPILYVYRDDKAWGGIKLKSLDPEKLLNNSGGKVNYVFNNLQINDTELVRVNIDPYNLIKEISKKNNSFQKRLTVVLPDLTVSDIYLNNLDRLVIGITNNGSGAVNKKYWEQSPVSLHVYRDGKPWGGISLKTCDPSQKLHLPKGKALYISNIHINNSEQIQVVIDPQNMVRESNENNNSFRKLLNRANPDLAISNLWVVNGNWLAVQIINNGPKSIDSKYWDQNPVYFEIYRSGENWGRFSLKTIDPHLNLKKPGGKVVYILNGMRILGSEEIRAVIDSQNMIPEADETNNSFQKILVAQN